jgi:biopolymer transport protein ExbD
MAAKYDEDEKPQVQLTSMMDCIFLMLIFFLVSSQLKKIEKEIPLELPVADATQDVKAAPDLVTVSVDSKGDLYVNSKPVGAAGLRSALQAAVAENPDRRIRIDGDMFAPFRSIVQVLDTCQQERLNVVGIHTADGLRK